MPVEAPDGPPSGRPFRSVLVANRGEIACRVIRTLRRLGIRSVAVYSDPDRTARHVRMADVAVRLGPAEPAASYLDIDAVVNAALTSGAQAIHPGYGFLSENADLARACVAAGVTFIGPGPDALDLMADKIRAKAHVARAGLPVIPGVAEPGLTDAELAAAAADVGYPLLIKPSAGGGGKGMHVVGGPEELPAALRAARRVASAAFGDDSLLLEHYVSSPRHIEVQVLADAHGHVIHLGERECSLQRRHQKVIEEAPSPFVDAAMRRRIGELGCAVARSVGYVGAGTVELLVSADAPSDFSFMEMNTRLQVEHPVTEMVTGLDLVEWQVRIAAGELLALPQDDVHLTGHAVEARLYAENPARGFLPSTGTVLLVDEPTGEGIRVDSSLVTGLEVTATYDPLLAKVVAWGTDRDQALARLDTALARTTVLGVHTTIEFLRQLLAEPAVRAGALDTGLLERSLAEMRFAAPEPAALTAAALWAQAATADGRPGSPPRAAGPWHSDGWRMGADHHTRHSLATSAQDSVDVVVRGEPDDAMVTVGDGEPLRARLVRRGSDTADLEIDGTVRTFRIVMDGDVMWVGQDGAGVELRLRSRADQLAAALRGVTRAPGTADPMVRSPMPGTVVTVHVETGDHVAVGQTLLTVEAMKMEHRLAATTDGIVTLEARPADRVKLDQVVATITPHPHEGSTE